jgi:dinuclear metal center YbgI/SA1388 family protein
MSVSKGETMKTVRVADIIAVMQTLAPPVLAEEWDNCGLQVGSAQWPVKKILVALDPLPGVVQQAARDNVDLVITHHPLLIRPLRVIDVETAVGKIIETALAAKVALYAAHTNLDSAQDGVNTVLAQAIGLRDLIPLVPPGKGTALDPANPSSSGMGRLGRLDRGITLESLARRIKTDLGLATVKVAGDPAMAVQEVAVCSGSGSSLLDPFLATSAQVFVSGDLRYHDARRVEDAGRGLIDVGHFASEHLVIGPIVARLSAAASFHGWPVDVEPCRLERDPFFYISDGASFSVDGT